MNAEKLIVNTGAKLGYLYVINIGAPITNNGIINGQYITINGDITNNGTWSSSNTVINGSGTTINADSQIGGSLVLNTTMVHIPKTFTLNGILSFNAPNGLISTIDIAP